MRKYKLLAAASLLSFAVGYGASATLQSFDDVPAGHWAAPGIDWASSNEIMNGPGDNPGNFEPGEAVNRAQLATVLYRSNSELQAQINALEARVNNLEGGSDDSAELPYLFGTTGTGDVKPIDEFDHVRGDTTATITIFEYSDFECPFCETVHPTLKQLVADYDGEVSWVYRHFPLSFHDPMATRKAVGSECAAELGGVDAFWGYADRVMEDSIDTDEEIVDLAVDLGLVGGKFEECLDSGKYESRVAQDLAEGTEVGITGTPGHIILNNKTGAVQSVPGAQPIEAFKYVIDEMLAE